ncbi:outer membrane lipoprotein-sorting protein [Thermospira aquatica]|uniref:Outer membrane lipoprotein-sorting protein n=1 Tax=Thermospira aquatica TaxID=2828656 RepID=A0AAX3BCI4_9SPIR|nr:outer membrane lipoprotein-sorting protein [Thermospira aquatica]URA09813.1 outer membrane lipoprotein-sorting protein [Thermospira aquatica]
MTKKTGIFLMLMVWTECALSLTGQEVLDKIEANLSAPVDQTALCEITLGKIGGNLEEKRTMRIWSAGKEKRVIRFLSPSSVKNITLLVRGSDSMYIYLPAYKKIRRIQGTTRDQNFQGTDFSYREIGSYEYSKDYHSSVKQESENEILLELVRKQDSDAPYTRILMTVDKTVYLPVKLQMYDAQGLKKVLTILQREKKEYWILSKVRMEDVKRHHYTEITLKEVVFNSGLEKKNIFTERFIQAE